MMVDGELYGRVTPERFDEIVADWRETADGGHAVYVPRDAAALSLGAERVADAIARGEAAARRHRFTIVRNGTRGMCWLEPLVEVETPAGRIAYGPVTAADVRALFEAGFLARRPARALGSGPSKTFRISPEQERLTFARVGITDPVSLDDYLAHDGYTRPRARARDEPAGHRQRSDRLGPARPRRRGVPDRHQVEDRAGRAGRPEIRHLQCRRGRLGHVSRIAC